jgi:ABC-type sulfate/molybdate transport systems ATPase subunit
MQSLVGRELSFRYGKRTVLTGVDVDVGPGQVHVLVGPSGSGKTTLLWLMAGLLTPTAGAVAMADAAGRLIAADYRRERIGMVFQQPGLWHHLTVERHLHLVLSGKGLRRDGRCQRIAGLLERTNLSHLAGRRPGELSGGERQRLAIARAMVVEPRWLMLDEPLAHLDGPTRDSLFGLLRGLLADTQAGVLMATHNAAEALRIADCCTVMGEGRVLQSGPVAEVYRRPVSLAAALGLGPASEIRGQVRRGRLLVDGQVVLDGLADDTQEGSASLILRPEGIRFVPGEQGPAEVASCELTTGGHRLTVLAAGQRVIVQQAEAVAGGRRGRLVRLGDGSSAENASRKEG